MNYNRLLEGKTALITSGAMGIGKAIAKNFVKQGAKVIIADINEEKLGEVLDFLVKYNELCSSYVCDMGDKEAVYNLVQTIKKEHGDIDILVNSVGINNRTLLHEMEEDTLDRIMDVNFKSGYRFMKAFIPRMIENGGGTIVNISSIHSLMTMPENSAYSASKGAVNAMARAVALDYASYNIRINNVALGYVLSDMNRIGFEHIGDETEIDKFLTEKYNYMQPLRAGTCEDVANTVLYLASDMSRYLTGQTICLDGGASIKAH